MPTQQRYDVIVLGNDFAGLVAACLCAARGMRVLVAADHAPPDCYPLNNETFPTRPFAMSGYDGPGFQRVLSELQLSKNINQQLVPCQLLTPDARIDSAENSNVLRTTLQRELGPAFTSWLLSAQAAQQEFGLALAKKSFPPTNFWDKRTLHKLLTSCHQSCQHWLQQHHSQEEQTLSEIAVLAQSGSLAPEPLERARAFASLQNGVVSLPGGWHEWRTLFRNKCQSHNGEFLQIHSQHWTIDWGNIVRLRGPELDLTCRHIIAAAPLHTIIPALDEHTRHKLLTIGYPVTPVAFRYTLNLLIHNAGIPEPMAAFAWSQQVPHQTVLGGNFASFHRTPASGANRSILTIEGLAPADSNGRPQLSGMRERLLHHARALLPFLDHHLEFVDSPHDHSQRQRNPDQDDHNKSQPLPAVWNSPAHRNLSMQALSPPGLKHLSIASCQSLPGLGLEGQMIAAWNAAQSAGANS